METINNVNDRKRFSPNIIKIRTLYAQIFCFAGLGSPYNLRVKYLGLMVPFKTALFFPQNIFNRSAFPCTCTLPTEVPLMLTFSGIPRQVGMTQVSSMNTMLFVQVSLIPFDNRRMKSMMSTSGMSSSCSHFRSFRVNKSSSLPNNFNDRKPLGVILRKFTWVKKQPSKFRKLNCSVKIVEDVTQIHV